MGKHTSQVIIIVSHLQKLSSQIPTYINSKACGSQTQHTRTYLLKMEIAWPKNLWLAILFKLTITGYTSSK